MKNLLLFILLFPLAIFGQTSNELSIEKSLNGNLFMYTTYLGSIQIDTTIIGDSTYQSGLVIAKIDSTGNSIWAKNIDISPINCGGKCGKHGFEIDTEENTLLAIPFFHFSIDGFEFNYIVGITQIAVIKIDANGNILWYKIIKTNHVLGSTPQIAISNESNIFIAIPFDEHIEIDSFFLETSLPNLALLKINPNGQIISLNTLGLYNTGEDIRLNSLQIDSSDNLYAVGSFREFIESNSSGYIDEGGSSPYVCKFDSIGNIHWLKAFIDKGLDFSVAYECIINSNSEQLYVSGYYADTLIITPDIIINNPNKALKPFIISLNLEDGQLFWYKVGTSNTEGYYCTAGSVDGDEFDNLGVVMYGNKLFLDTIDITFENYTESSILLLNNLQEPICVVQDSFLIQDVSLIQNNTYSISNKAGGPHFFDSRIKLQKINTLNCETIWEKYYQITNINLPVSNSSINDPKNSIVLYPNPLTDQFTITNLPPGEKVIIKIYDLRGIELMKQEFINDIEIEVNLPARISSGIFVVSIHFQNIQTYKKIVVAM